jgi:hypothetical protein
MAGYVGRRSGAKLAPGEALVCRGTDPAWAGPPATSRTFNPLQNCSSRLTHHRLGFQPDVVIIKAHGAQIAVIRTASVAADISRRGLERDARQVQPRYQRLATRIR